MPTYRMADHEWLSAPGDVPANTRWEGIIDPSGIATVAQLGFWPWDVGAIQAGAAQVRLLDADGKLDSAALGDLSGELVALQQVDLDGALADAVPVARYVVDRLVVDSDGRKTLRLRDAHDALDKIINTSLYPSSASGLAGQRMPMSIGQVFNAPVTLTGSDGSVGWLADTPQAVSLLRDRGDPMEAGTWTLDSFQQQLLLESPPLGPMTADLISTTGRSLELALREVMRRCGITAWSSSDAEAIDTVTGYYGIGLWTDQPISGRVAMARMLASYGAWYWQDADGVLRLTRIVDPSDLTTDLDVDSSDLDGDVTYTTDTAPGLTTRMAWRPNARPMRETDFVSDLVDVPPDLRAELSSPQAGIVTAAGAATLPSEYRHALTAEPFQSLHWRQSDAQAEIDRVIELYQEVRRNWIVQLSGVPGLALRPGQCVRLKYPRHGLTIGRKLLVRSVERNAAAGTMKLVLWG